MAVATTMAMATAIFLFYFPPKRKRSLWPWPWPWPFLLFPFSVQEREYENLSPNIFPVLASLLLLSFFSCFRWTGVAFAGESYCIQRKTTIAFSGAKTISGFLCMNGYFELLVVLFVAVFTTFPWIVWNVGDVTRSDGTWSMFRSRRKLVESPGF